MNSKVTVQSFLCVQGEFVSVDSEQAIVEDSKYVEGAIVLHVDGREILGFDLNDLVDQLWGYIVEGLQSVSAGRAFETYFPDQPVRLSMTPQGGGRVEIMVEGSQTKRGSVSETLLLASLVPAARLFFSRMLQLNPQKRLVYEHLLSQLDAFGRRRGGASHPRAS